MDKKETIPTSGRSERRLPVFPRDCITTRSPYADCKRHAEFEGSGVTDRVLPRGKFFHLDGERFLIKGVTYGTFAPDAEGYQFPADPTGSPPTSGRWRSSASTPSASTPPRRGHLLDEAAGHGLRVMVGLPWSQHVAFLDDRDARADDPARRLVDRSRELGGSSGGADVRARQRDPAGVVRWHGRQRVERFLRELYDDGKGRGAGQPVHLRQLSADRVSRPLVPRRLRVQRLPAPRSRAARATSRGCSTSPGNKPLLLAEAGADSIREGEDGQAEHHRDAHPRRLRGGRVRRGRVCVDRRMVARRPSTVDDWAFGLVDRDRRPKPARCAPSPRRSPTRRSAHESSAAWPRVSVVVCAYNAADTLDDCLASLERLTYPDYEVILVNDGSKDATGEIARRHPSVRAHRHRRTAA